MNNFYYDYFDCSPPVWMYYFMLALQAGLQGKYYTVNLIVPHYARLQQSARW